MLCATVILISLPPLPPTTAVLHLPDAARPGLPAQQKVGTRIPRALVVVAALWGCFSPQVCPCDQVLIPSASLFGLPQGHPPRLEASKPAYCQEGQRVEAWWVDKIGFGYTVFVAGIGFLQSNRQGHKTHKKGLVFGTGDRIEKSLLSPGMNK